MMDFILGDTMLDFNSSYRTTYQEISDHYSASPEAAFKKGNHSFAASISECNSELHAISLIMQGNVLPGLQVLKQLPVTKDSLFYINLGSWMLGDDAGCRIYSKELSSRYDLTDFDGKCCELFEKVKINVLLMTREFSCVGIDFGPFHFKTIGFTKNNDIVLSISDGIEEILSNLAAIDFVPNFLFCFRPEYQLIPNQLQNLPFHKIAFVSDFDLHLYQKYDDFRRFDSLLVYSATDHYELSRVLDIPVFTHVFSHTLSSAVAPGCRRSEDRKYDIHVTGSSFREFFADKTNFLYHLSQLDSKYAVRIDDGDRKSVV